MSILLALASLGLPSAAPAGDAQWPAWRGPNGDGSSSATDLPARWSSDENVLWRTELPWWSGATPVVWGDHVFVMSPAAPPEGSNARHPGGDALRLIAIDARDGEVRWTRELDFENRLWRKSNETSPSPVTDGETVWATTGTGVVSAFDFEGERRWERNLQIDYGEFGLNWGYASSPLLVDGRLVFEVLHGTRTDEPSYVLALDAATGDELWRVERPTDASRESPDAYTTPLLLERDGRRQIVVTGADYATGHDPGSGAEVWRVRGLNPRRAPNYRVVASPLFVDDLLIVPTRVRPLLAIAIDDELAPTDEDIVWRWESQGAPDVPSPTTDGRYLYLVDDAGLVTCVDPGSGEAVWGPERTTPGTVSSSPVLADGKLYFTNEAGVTTVVRAGPKFELIATNELGGGYTLASLAIAGGRLFLRTGSYLYCLGKR